jgi:hypothetical protein
VHNRVSPGAVLTIGLCLASTAFVLWAVQVTAFDAGPLHRNAKAVLVESPAHDAMVERVVHAIVLSGPAGDSVNPVTIAAVANQTVEQPEFVAAFARALDRVQAHVVNGTTGPITLDPELVTRAIRAAAAGSPGIASAISASPPAVGVPTDEVPDLARWADLWEAVGRAFAFFGLLLITYGMLKIDHRLWAFGKIGRWAIVVGVGTLAMFWLVPRALLRPLGGWIAVGGAVATSGDVLVPVSLILIGTGAMAVIAAHHWEAMDRKRLLSAIPRTANRSTRGPSHWESPV